MTLDSSNCIYKIFYTTINELEESFEKLCRFVKDKNLDTLLTSLSYEYSKENSSNDFRDHYTILFFKEALKNYRGDLIGTNDLDPNTILCRCSKIDNKKLKKLIQQNSGVYNQVQKNSNLSLICGSCTHLVKESFYNSCIELDIYENKNTKSWKENLENYLNEFSQFSPAEFDGAQIKIKSLAMPKVELEILSARESLTQELAYKSLMNYLSSELRIFIELKITLNNSSSNLNH